MTFLGVTKRIDEIDYGVTEIELEYGVSAGIYLRSLSEDTIPPYYEHSARVKAGKSLAEWEAMSRWDKALVVAIMQIDNAVQGHQAEAEIKHARANVKKAE